MPQQMTKVTTVYTLEELKDLPKDKRGETPYDKAIRKITEDANEDGFYCRWLTDDMNNWFREGAGPIADNECPFDNGEMGEWDYDRRNLSFTLSVYVREYMKRNKLIGKQRSLYNWLEGGDCYIKGEVKSGYNRNSPYSPLASDFGYDLLVAINDDSDLPKVRRDKLEAQAEAVLKHIGGSAEWANDYLMKWIVADIDYRWSEEFAKEEAEANELKFVASGAIYRE